MDLQLSAGFPRQSMS